MIKWGTAHCVTAINVLWEPLCWVVGFLGPHTLLIVAWGQGLYWLYASLLGRGAVSNGALLGRSVVSHGGESLEHGVVSLPASTLEHAVSGNGTSTEHAITARGNIIAAKEQAGVQEMLGASPERWAVGCNDEAQECGLKHVAMGTGHGTALERGLERAALLHGAALERGFESLKHAALGHGAALECGLVSLGTSIERSTTWVVVRLQVCWSTPTASGQAVVARRTVGAARWPQPRAWSSGGGAWGGAGTDLWWLGSSHIRSVPASRSTWPVIR